MAFFRALLPRDPTEVYCDVAEQHARHIDTQKHKLLHNGSGISMNAVSIPVLTQNAHAMAPPARATQTEASAVPEPGASNNHQTLRLSRSTLLIYSRSTGKA
jgi:hypothetical protein